MTKKRRNEGSISLFLVIVLVAVLALESVLIQRHKLRDLELRSSRTIDLAGDVILASYNEDLAEYYGLFAFEEAGLPTDVRSYIDSELSGLPASAKWEFETLVAFTEVEGFQEQVSDYMKVIYPQLVLQRVMDELTVLDDFADVVVEEDSELGTTKSLKEQIEKLLLNKGIDLALSGLRTFLNKQNSSTHILRNYFLDEEEHYSGEESYNPALSSDEQHQGDAVLNQLIDSDNRLSWNGEDVLVMLSEGIHMLDFQSNASYDRLLMTEYILDMSTNWADQRLASDYIDARTNLRGIKLDTFYHARELETEYVLSGYETELAAKTMLASLLNSTRLAIHAISLLQDETEMQKLSATAGILAVGIAALSAGSVVIEPDTLKYVLLFLRAQIDAASDVKDLLDNKAVELLPYSDVSDISFYYRDYLRVFLLVGNGRRQIERFAETIEANIGSALFVSVDLKLIMESKFSLYSDFTLHSQRSYLNRSEEVVESDE